MKGIKKVATAAGACGQQASVYGACMLEHYKDVRKDACIQEFNAFKACVVKALGKRF
jgi:hypothetical protein